MQQSRAYGISDRRQIDRWLNNSQRRQRVDIRIVQRPLPACNKTVTIMADMDRGYKPQAMASVR